MQLPDDMELKAEIEEITSRIDNIMERVQQYFPASKPSSDSGESSESE